LRKHDAIVATLSNDSTAAMPPLHRPLVTGTRPTMAPADGGFPTPAMHTNRGHENGRAWRPFPLSG